MANAALRKAATRANAGCDQAEQRQACGEADGADDGEDEADELGEPQRRHRLALGDGPRPGSDEVGEDQPVRAWRGPRQALIANTTACAPKTTAAAGRLTADTNSATTKTAVVTHAANRGPRTSTSLVFVRHRNAPVLDELAGNARLSARASANALSDNNNSNNPRCGTDLLRGAW